MTTADYDTPAVLAQKESAHDLNGPFWHVRREDGKLAFEQRCSMCRILTRAVMEEKP